MIPAFPEFKAVTVANREEIEAHTHRYSPYSDFNFTSLWAWDTSDERMVSELNGNLVARFTDYSSHEPFLSFLGSEEPEHTARTLIEYCRGQGLPETLKLVPEISIRDIRPSILTVEEDRDNFDYLLSVSEIAALQGAKFKGKRKVIAGFSRTYPGACVEVGDLSDTEVQKQIINILHVWEDRKKSENKKYELQHEEAAVNRLFQTAGAHDLIVTGVFLEGIMIGFSIDELLPNQYAISHFFKADSSYRGVYDFLNEKVAENLSNRGIALWNWEQDLGIESLKISKTGYRPVDFLKKYTVSLNARSVGDMGYTQAT